MTPEYACSGGCGIVTTSGAPTGCFTRRHIHRQVGIVPTIVSSGRYSTGKAFEWDTTGGANTGYVGHDLAIQGTLLIIRYSLFFNTLPDTNTDLFLFSSNSGTFGGLRFNTATGKIQGSFGTTFGSTGVVVETNRTYEVDMRIDVSANPSKLDVSIDGVALAQVTKNQAATTLIGYRQGPQISGVVLAPITKFRMSDFVTSITPADYPLGNYFVIPLYPNRDGTHVFIGPNPDPNSEEDISQAASDFRYNDNSLTPVPVNSVIVNSYLDEYPVGSGGDFISQNILNETSYCEIGFPSISDIHTASGIEVVSAFHSSATSSVAISTRIREAGWEGVIYDDADMSQAATPIYASRMIPLHPSGEKWTIAHINALLLRFGYGALLSKTATPYFDGFCLEIAMPQHMDQVQLAGTVNGVAGAKVRGDAVMIFDGGRSIASGGTITRQLTGDVVKLSDYVLYGRYDFHSTLDQVVDSDRAIVSMTSSTNAPIVGQTFKAKNGVIYTVDVTFPPYTNEDGGVFRVLSIAYNRFLNTGNQVITNIRQRVDETWEEVKTDIPGADYPKASD